MFSGDRCERRILTVVSDAGQYLKQRRTFDNKSNVVSYITGVKSLKHAVLKFLSHARGSPLVSLPRFTAREKSKGERTRSSVLSELCLPPSRGTPLDGFKVLLLGAACFQQTWIHGLFSNHHSDCSCSKTSSGAPVL